MAQPPKPTASIRRIFQISRFSALAEKDIGKERRLRRMESDELLNLLSDLPSNRTIQVRVRVPDEVSKQGHVEIAIVTQSKSWAPSILQ